MVDKPTSPTRWKATRAWKRSSLCCLATTRAVRSTARPVMPMERSVDASMSEERVREAKINEMSGPARNRT